MTEDRLNRFEELAEKVMSNANDETRLKGLDGLLSKMQNNEPTLFDVVKSCGNWVLRYSDYRQTNKATARYYVEAYDSFRAYEADTSEQAENRMQKMEIQREHEYPKYRTVETIENVGMYESGTIAGIIYVREYDERWQYNQSAPTFGEGYCSYWLCNKDTFLYRLLCALMGKGVGNIAENTKRELQKDYQIVPRNIVPRNTALEIPADLQKQIDLRNEADEDADRAANELRIAASAAYLWLALNTEKELLQEERALYGLGDKSQPTIPDNLRTQEANELLSVIEKVSIDVKGKGLLPLLDRKTLPWGYASRAGLRAVAEVTRGLIIGVQWHDFEIACDFKSLQSAPEIRIVELEKALDNAGYKNYYKK